MKSKSRSRSAALPRVTIMAYSKRDLARFVDAVNSLTYRIEELEDLVKELRVAVGELRARKPGRRPPATSADANGQAPSADAAKPT